MRPAVKAEQPHRPLAALLQDQPHGVGVGDANGNIGDIATAEAHKFGGYEPIQSPLRPEAEAEILRGLNRLSDRVVGDVFESFSKHPPGTKLRSK